MTKIIENVVLKYLFHSRQSLFNRTCSVYGGCYQSNFNPLSPLFSSSVDIRYICIVF